VARSTRSLSPAFGKALAAFRGKSGLSQEKFAAEVGMHRTHVSQLERGLKSPTLDTIAAIAAALKVKPHELVRAAEQRLR
jgi:transcriptional regulator with XRE-family HTH domain